MVVAWEVKQLLYERRAAKRAKNLASTQVNSNKTRTTMAKK